MACWPTAVPLRAVRLERGRRVALHRRSDPEGPDIDHWLSGDPDTMNSRSITDPDVVRSQYADSSNLNARVQLYLDH